jgi:putative glycosyltransferase (TIGR04348 family)
MPFHYPRSIGLVTPAPPKSQLGNRVTAERWAKCLRGLGHRVAIVHTYDGQPFDLLVALHARKSYPAIARFHRAFPKRPLIVALTGTDLYHDLQRSSRAMQSLSLATRLVILQTQAIQELPGRYRSKAKVIYQSVEPIHRRTRPRPDVFEVCVLGHLRPVKDPFRTALAARQLPATSRVEIVQIGAALSPSMQRRAEHLQRTQPRFRWLGELPRHRALAVLARCRLLVLTSKMEGGANAVCEALALQVPILSSRIGGTLGILGSDYPGYFPVGDTSALSALLRRAECDSSFLELLRQHCAAKRHLVDPVRENGSWRSLLLEL